MYTLTLKLFARPLFIFGSPVFAPSLSLSLSLRGDVAAHIAKRPSITDNPCSPRVFYTFYVQKRASAKCVSISPSDGRHGGHFGILRAGARFLEL